MKLSFCYLEICHYLLLVFWIDPRVSCITFLSVNYLKMKEKGKIKREKNKKERKFHISNNLHKPKDDHAPSLLHCSLNLSFVIADIASLAVSQMKNLLPWLGSNLKIKEKVILGYIYIYYYSWLQLIFAKCF